VPTVLTDADGINVEKVAALRADLIVGIYSGMKKSEYAALSKIAPVIAQPKGEVDYGSSWQEETLLAGRAAGRPEKAKALVAKSERVIADAAAAHPEFKGQTAANVSDYQGIFVYGPQDVRSRMLTDLGFTYPPALRTAFKTDFADGDQTPAQLKRAPVYSKLKVRKEGRDVFVTGKDRVYEATSFPTVLSIPLLVKELVPRLAAAADGDPGTTTDQRPAA
jgi:iron complex transport system substrate-binding protein